MTERRTAGAVKDLARLLLGHASRYRDGRLQDVATRALRDDTEDRRWVVHAVNASLRVRQRLDYALRLEPRRVLSRLRYPFRGRVVGGEPSRSLSLLCPTRGRVRNVRDFLTSVRRTAVAPGRIEALFYVDDDDPDLAGYRDLFGRARRLFGEIGRCELRVGEPVGVPAAWNRLAEAATGDLLLMANDDQLYVDRGWDVAVDSRVGELTRLCPDGVLCLYFDAGQYPEGGCDFPILSRTWYETVGYFTPTIFQQWEVERWLFDIAERLGRLYPVPGVLVEHRHYQDYKAPFDATYQRHRMTREKSLADHALFLRTRNLRDAEIGRLRAVIDRGAPRISGRAPGADASGPAAKPAPSAVSSPVPPPVPPPVPSPEARPALRRRYAELVDELHAAGLGEQAAACADSAVRQGLWAHPLQRPVDYRPELPLREEYDAGAFWFDAHLAENHTRLLKELDRFLDAGRFGAGDTPGHGWDRLRLLADGAWTPEAGRSFPVTVSVLSAIPEATLPPGSAVDLGLLPPRTRVPARCGPSNAVLRVEFGLRVGEGARVRLGNSRAAWPRGGCLVFDGGLEREVWNDGAAPHVVLSFHVPHPDLSPRARPSGEAPAPDDGPAPPGRGA
ncbi:hypothetical protein GCM10017673_31620 [Streptosporangium violaceochromogenes]|nr:hypothetical protein GCM10017673_31620 [Streptosporangium violaceochromogenes]